MLYNLGNEELMNDSICECRQNYEDYWGQILVNALRAVHYVYYGSDDLEEDDEESGKDSESNENNLDTTNWILTQRQANLKKGRE